MRGATVAALAALWGCNPFDPTYPTDIPCGPGGECPPGQSCAGNNRCFSNTDAGAGVCPLGDERELVLGEDFVSGQLTGTSRYLPACAANPTGGEEFWFVDVPEVSGDSDLVIDLQDLVATEGVDDAAIDISRDCTPATSQVCTNATIEGAGEVSVLQHVTPGRKYVTVDTGTAPNSERLGLYRVRAFLRPIVAAGEPCDFHVEANRCAPGLYCVDGGDGARCAALATEDEGPDNDACSATTRVVTADAVITGVTSVDDADFIEIAPPTGVNLRAIVYRAEDGGCPQDLEVTRLDAACQFEDSGDDNGIGGCGFIEDETPLDPAVKHYFVVQPAGQSVTQPTPYTVVIDLGYTP